MSSRARRAPFVVDHDAPDVVCEASLQASGCFAWGLTSTFAERDHDGICVPMQAPADDLDTVMAGLTAARNVDGILVTMPHKFTAFAHCATSSKRAKMLKVVSVMRRNTDGTWHGDILDGLAFVKAQKDHGAQPEEARVLLIGAGGAGSAIAIALLEAGVRDVIAGHGLTSFLEAAEASGCQTANCGHTVEAAQDVMADFMLQTADSSVSR